MYKTLSIYMSILSYAATAQGTTADEVSRGQSIYAKCLACHSPERNRTGPKHCGLIGRRAGSLAGFDYSLAMQQSAIIWDEKTLDEFLASPLDVIPGTKMAIAGISNMVDRRNLVSFLVSLKKDARCH